MQKIYTVILAAGTSSRLGYNKLTVKIDGKSVISRALKPFCIEGMEKIFVIVKPQSIDVRREVEKDPVLRQFPFIFIENPYYEKGMSTSIKAAIPFISDADATFFHLGDKPFIRRKLIVDMVGIYLKGDAKIIVPVYKKKKGHPVIMKINPFIEEIRMLTGDKGLREIIDKHMEDVVFIESDKGSIFDIDTEKSITLLNRKGYRIEKS